MTTLADWKAAFRALDECPWAGPRPLVDNDRAQYRLVGREKMADQFAASVLQHYLVVLTGDSGVGKSSLLNAGLVHKLKESGFQPFVCNNWTSLNQNPLDVEAFIRSKITFPVEHGSDGTLCGDLESEYGDTAVIIFDQFEELIRYQPGLFVRVVEWIIDANRRYRTHIVLSLRSEYRHRLRPIEIAARPFSMSTIVLEALEDETAIRQIISGTSEKPLPITPAAADLIWKEWTTAHDRSKLTWSDVGLLHLQGTLYALHDAVGAATVGVAHIEALKARAQHDEPTIFNVGIRAAVRLKLERCLKACADESLPQPLDRVLIEGTKAVAHRLIPHLSSGGYKLEREEWDLTRIALAREFERLTKGREANDDRPVLGDVERIFRDLASRARTTDRTARPSHGDGDDLLCVSRCELARAAAIPWRVPSTSARLVANGVDVAPWDEDRHDVSAGPLLGFSATAVLIENLRRVVFALCWLEASELVRASSPSSGKTMLTLIHDGFGHALEHWAASESSRPEEALSLLSAASGETYHWLQGDNPDTPHAAFNGSQQEVILTNLRWRDCQVSAAFRRVVFVNCDFRGSRFRNCRFHGVIFINCLLDGSSFEECTMLGGTTARPPDLQALAREIENHPAKIPSEALPDFCIYVKPDIVEELRRYREHAAAGNNEGNTVLYSRTSGLAAIPWRSSYGHGVHWHSESGGLTMYGGRLSSLMIRRCTFADGGALALRHVAGSALDIVEQEGGGKIEITQSAIRGLTVTRPIDREYDRAASGTEDALQIVVDDCIVTNVWFGHGLTGEAKFTHSKIWQACNTSDRRHFEVSVGEESFYYGLVNVAPPGEGSQEMRGYHQSEIVDLDNVVRGVRNMDYRRVPGRFELADPKP